ncbi:MAG: hypothetical protein Q8Q60_00710 [Candidatus Chromulinivorax sp.]|nr:hypothetical protein [Candidatus Chromulinivorax sp.]
MMTLTTMLAIALILQSNNTGNALTADTTKSVQVFDIRNSAQYQLENKDVCELLRDSIYADSEYLEQSKYQYPSDFMILSPDEARQNIQYSLAHFNKNGCDKNQYIHYSDRNLFKTLDEDLKK